MMDPAVKTALAVCILLIGFCLAQLFRHERPPSQTPQPESSVEQLLIPHKPFPQSTKKADAKTRKQSLSETEAAQAVRRNTELPGFPPEAVILNAGQSDEPPPLPKEYPGETSDMRPSALRPLRPIPFALLARPESEQRIHRVVDGDTLPALAERYLGDTSRWEEIFAANRDVLTDPRLLPIGVELKLPPLKKEPNVLKHSQ